MVGGDTETIDRDRGPAGPPRAPHLFVVLEAARPLAGGARYSLAGVADIAIGRGPAHLARRSTVGGKPTLALTLPDPSISSTHAAISRTPTGWLIEDRGSKNGIVIDGVAQRRAYLDDDAVFELGHAMFVLRTVETPAGTPDDLVEPAAGGTSGMATLLPRLAHDLAEARAIAATTRASILILGPTGSGKELCARAMHAASGRKGPFVAVNCAAIPAELMESELFGYRKGAFSGATEDRRGLVAVSSGGTLFLDEVGDLPAPAQAAILRVLQEREVRAVGSTTTESVDLRVVAATHKDLGGGGGFRDDLFARLAGHVVTLPAVAQRREDLGVLIASLLPKITGDPARVSVTVEAARALVAHDWPRNVRELEACLVRACSLAAGAAIDRAHLPDAVRDASFDDETTPYDAPLDADDQARRERLVALLEAHRGNVTEVARQMATLRQTVQKWIKRYRIDVQRYRT
jgi:transcriptional regulator of acetoin/glycerol metabolism